MSSPGSSPRTRPEALKKLAQLQIEKIKKEEEEEQWISGEELYTEGSSDEEDLALRAKKRSEKVGKKTPRSAGQKTRKHLEDGKSKTTTTTVPPALNVETPASDSIDHEKTKDLNQEKENNQSTLKIESTIRDKIANSTTLSLDDAGGDGDDDDDDDDLKAEISWRPKRGFSESLSPIADAEEAYLKIVEKVNKLKKFLLDGNKKTSCLVKLICENEKKSREEANLSESPSLQSFLSSDWKFLEEGAPGDIKSAFSNIKNLDTLLEITSLKEKVSSKFGGRKSFVEKEKDLEKST